ncbi:MAG: substrate-binding domain-containing protein [Planctomycetia bacterium]|nr:substrate-binding domain-containing protein [Planctomycetia bacterium]
MLFASLLAAGCDSAAPAPQNATPTTPAAPTAAAPAAQPASRGIIGVSLLTLDNPFFRVIGDNITAEGKRSGYETIVVSADGNVSKQHDQLKDFIVKKVAAIVLSPAESKSIVPAIQEANKAGIPVFTVDIPCNEPNVKIVSQIATDNEGGGRDGGLLMIEALGAEAGGKVGVLHAQSRESARLRVKGFKSVLDEHNAKHPGKFEVVAIVEGDGAKEVGYTATLDMMQAHPEITGIFAINDPSALGARTALEKLGKADNVKIIGFDGQPDGKKAILEGKIFGDPIQHPDVMGVEVVKAIVKQQNGETPEPRLQLPTERYRKAEAEKEAKAMKTPAPS